jgi:hypothetical protein
LEQLTTVHCEKVHGVSRQQVIEQYGKPKPLFAEFAVKFSESAAVISQRDFVNSQLLTDRIRSKSRKFHSDR